MSKVIAYEMLLLKIIDTIKEEKDLYANFANTSALLYEHMPDVNWVGFYILKRNQLVLGPFQGKAARVRIEIGEGVCGSCVKEKQTKLIRDVHTFEGHIACDAASNAEIVIPIYDKENIVAVLDIDSPIKERFDETDQQYLEKVVSFLESSCDFVIT